MDYDAILEELNKRKRDIQFSKTELDKLTDFERKDIEEKLVELIKNGVSTSYKYIPNLKKVNLRIVFPYNNLPNLPINDVLDINKYLYLTTHDSGYLNNIISYSLNDSNAFSLLLYLYNEEELKNKNELLNIILSVIKFTKNKEYFNMFNSRCSNLIKGINIKEKYDNIKPNNWIPNSMNDESPINIMDENGKILTEEEAKMKVDKDYNDYLSKQNYYEMILSGILGFAIGDAIGVPIEFTRRSDRQSNPISNMKGFGSHNVPEGTWSDDTSMTIATMDSIIENNSLNYQDIMDRFLEWITNAKYTATDKVFDIGITTSNALNKYKNYKSNPVECGSNNFRDNGNGSLMRILPIVLYINSLSINNDERTKVINEASSLTHGHEISKMGCKIYSDYVERLIANNFDKFEAYRYIKSIDYSKYYSFETVEIYRKILKEDISKLDIDDIQSSGYVVSTLEAALWSVLTSNTYEETVVKAINLGEDTDTIGAIAGSLAGMIYKYKTFPKKWTQKLKKEDYLIDLSMKFANVLEDNKKKEFSEIEENSKIM